MAIKAYNAGTNNNLIDVSYKFQEGDMLVFDISKNLFTKGLTRDQLATKEELNLLKTQVGAFDQGHPVDWANIQNVPEFLLPQSLSGLATESYVLEKIASVASDGQIDLSEFITETEVINLINNIQHPTPDWNLIINKPTLFSGNYNDLINQPSIPTDISQLTDTTNLLNHFSGDYNDLTNKPALFDGDYNSLINKPNVFSGNYNDLYNVPTIPSVIGLASEAYVQGQLQLYSTTQYVDDQIAAALSGGSIDLSSYVTENELATAIANIQHPTTDLSGYYTKTQVDNLLPTVPTDISQLGDSQGLLTHVNLSGYATENYVQNQLQAYQPTIDLSPYALKTDLFSGSYNDLTDKPVLFSGQYIDLIGTPQIFSGDYNDLTNQPIIPSIDGLASISYVDQQIANVSSGGSVDLSSYVTETELETALSNYQPSIDLTAYYTAAQVDGLIQVNTDNQILSLNGTVLTISGGNSIDISSVNTNVDLTGYATELYVQQQVGNINTFSGNYNDLTNKPAIPSDISQLTDTTGLLIHTTNTDSQTLSLVNDILTISGGNSVDLSSYAGGGSVDLSNYYTKTEVDGLVFTGSYNDLTDKPTLFDGAYSSLTGTPTIPTDVSDLTDTTGLLNGGTANIDPWSIDSNGNFVPDTNEAYDIGSPEKKVRDIYLSSATIYLDEATLSRNSQGELLYNGSDLQDYRQLKNKPDLSNLTSTDVNNPNRPVTYTALNAELDGYVSDAELAAALANAGIFSGDYNDLTNKPTIPGPQTLSLSGNVLSISDGNSVDLTSVVGTGGGTGTVDLTGYATETYVQQQVNQAQLDQVANINDLSDVAIDGATTDHILAYNSVNQLWENVDLNVNFASKDYVTAQLASALSGGTIDLEGYATENFVTQKLLERGDHFSGDYNDLVNRPQLFSGNYNDLFNKPAGANDLELQLVGSNLKLVDVATNPDTTISILDLSSVTQFLDYSDLANLPSLFSGNYNDLVNKPTLFSGNYNDLANKPYIPSIAGLATEEYVRNYHDKPTIHGDKTFSGSTTFEETVTVKQSLSSHTAQKRTSALAIQTNDATPTEVVYADGSSVQFDPNTTVMLTVTVVASGVSVSDNAARTHKGIVVVDGTSAQFVGVVAEETLEQGSYGWNSEIYIDNAGQRTLSIRVTGSATETVNWTVFLESHEVVNL